MCVCMYVLLCCVYLDLCVLEISVMFTKCMGACVYHTYSVVLVYIDVRHYKSVNIHAYFMHLRMYARICYFIFVEISKYYF